MNDLDSLYSKANELFYNGENERAMLYFDEYVKQNPSNEVMWNNRAVVLSNLKRFDEALSSYDEAIRAKPYEPENYCNKGFTLEGMGRFDDALIWYNKALEIKPNDEHYIKLKTNLLKRTK